MTNHSRSTTENATETAVYKTAVRYLTALIIPFATAYILQTISGQNNYTIFFGTLGIVNWLMGLRWYGINGMGVRGGRALFAGTGFAVLGWIAFLVARILFIPIDALSTGIKDYVYLLLFESLALQLWTFGLLFRAMADWRGGLTAAFSSGIVFGGIALFFFNESIYHHADALTLPAAIYFIALGVMYGIIRLRTGSFIGMALVQAVQSFTGWVAFQSSSAPVIAAWNSFYTATIVAYLIITWRLWPKVKEDYRV